MPPPDIAGQRPPSPSSSPSPPLPSPRRLRPILYFLWCAAAALGIGLAGCAWPPGRPSDPQAGGVCRDISERDIAALFERWNASLQTGDPQRVVANYAARSILLPTVSNRPRLTPAEKEDYFRHFLQSRPSGKIDLRFIDIGCNTALDAGLYTFTFGATGEVVQARYTFTYRWYPGPAGGQWLITSHHSSGMPESQPN